MQRPRQLLNVTWLTSRKSQVNSHGQRLQSSLSQHVGLILPLSADELACEALFQSPRWGPQPVGCSAALHTHLCELSHWGAFAGLHVNIPPDGTSQTRKGQPPKNKYLPGPRASPNLILKALSLTNNRHLTMTLLTPATHFYYRKVENARPRLSADLSKAGATSHSF